MAAPGDGVAGPRLAQRPPSGALGSAVGQGGARGGSLRGLCRLARSASSVEGRGGRELAAAQVLSRSCAEECARCDSPLSFLVLRIVAVLIRQLVAGGKSSAAPAATRPGPLRGAASPLPRALGPRLFPASSGWAHPVRCTAAIASRTGVTTCSPTAPAQATLLGALLMAWQSSAATSYASVPAASRSPFPR